MQTTIFVSMELVLSNSRSCTRCNSKDWVLLGIWSIIHLSHPTPRTPSYPLWHLQCSSSLTTGRLFYRVQEFSCPFESSNTCKLKVLFFERERGIEWSLRACEQCVYFDLRARAVIKCVLRAASTLKNSYGEQRALRKFFGQNLALYWKKRFAPCNLADTVQPIPAVYGYVLTMMSDYAWYLRVCFSAVHQVNAQGDPQLSNPTLWTAHHRKKL